MAVESPENFNVLNVGLTGINLIEAAAGTGKTYSIATMVLRWILETGNTIDSVLAVTFTNYATAELKERILGFLEGALAFLESGNENDEKTDKTIKEICKRCADKKKAEAELRAAINDFDTASVFTIHGFCQKLIREHAFELGIDFDMKLSEETDTNNDAATTFFREYLSDRSMFEENGLNLLEIKEFRDKISKDELKGFISKAGIGIENKNIRTKIGNDPVINRKLTDIYKNLVQKASEIARKNRNRKNVMGYDDILLILYEVLKKSDACAIRKSMEEHYSFVLIDEFQDTDPLQYFIFKTLFCNGRHTVFFIGDPKQSIYSFRKADIFTYFETSCTPGIKKYVMGMNFRSSEAAVKAANEVFSPKNIFGDDELIKYEKVEPAKSNEKFCLLQNGTPFNYGLIVRQLDTFGREEDLKRTVCGLVSSSISEMIKKDSAFKIREEINKKTDERAVSLSDIAVLVATNDFALEVCEALKKAGIPAAVEAESAKELYIFSSEEAIAVQKLIHAASTKGYAEFKALLLTFFYNKNVDEIADENNSFSELHEKFRSCFAEWDKKGFLPAFSKFIEDESILSNIASKGERTVGILRQLSELINSRESEEGFSPLWTQKWFDDKIKSGKGSEDENIRAEGGRKECVRIMTLHKSKGLEFNIVFFPMILKQPKGSDWVTRHRKTDRGYEREMVFMPLKELQKDQSDGLLNDEKLEENRRIYVGITRAKYLTVCYTYAKKGHLEKTNFFHKEEREHVKLCSSRPSTEPAGHSVSTDEDFSEKTVLTEKPEEAERRIRPEWAISSFSSINSHLPGDSGTQKEELPDPDLPLADFPSGTEAGTVLHSIFEEADFKKDNDGLIESILKKKMNFKQSEFGAMAEAVKLCLKNVCSAPLFENEKTLKDLPEEGKITEMEFFIKTKNFEEQQLFEIIKDNYHTDNPGEGTVEQGFLHGFIDLVAKIGGKYYIIDWKSNNLGKRFADYDDAGIGNEMKKHNYYLQYMLYLAAFDRYMTSVDPEYSYEKSFGGIRYVFLRGVQEKSCRTGIFKERPDERELRKIQSLLEDEE